MKQLMIDNIYIRQYLEKLTHRVFKILPMCEEKSLTINEYIDSLVREITGNANVIFQEDLLLIVGTLKGLNKDNHKELKSDIFKTCDAISRIKERVDF